MVVRSGERQKLYLVMLFSTLFAANFGVLGAICLGILQLIRQGGHGEADIFASEVSGGDLVFKDGRLNVETDTDTAE